MSPVALTYEQACAKVAAARKKATDADAVVVAALAHQQKARNALLTARAALDSLIERNIKEAA